MNRMIVESARRGERLTAGALQRLFGSPPEESPKERLNRLLATSEAARQSGDEVALAVAESAIDELVDEARSARAEQPRDETGQFVGAEAPGFDGGFRGRRPVAGPGGAMVETASSLFARALMTSRQERAERGADEHTIIANI